MIYRAIIYLILILFISACSSTKETTTERNNPAPMQVQNWQERQLQDKNSPSGLTQEQIRKLDDFAEQKVVLACQLIAYDKQNNEALSEVEAADIKENIVKLENQISRLTKEIDAYCDNEDKLNYFNQIYKHKLRRCQSD
jgi:hypothetical protein